MLEGRRCNKEGRRLREAISGQRMGARMGQGASPGFVLARSFSRLARQKKTILKTRKLHWKGKEGAARLES
jgi:hypothetical protein